MIHTAEEIQLKYCGLCDNSNQIQQAINEARIEAIKECMNNSQIICKEANYDGGNLKVEYCVDTDVFKLLLDQIK